MIRLAKEDTPKARRERRIAGYYKNDYIALHLIRRFFLMTAAYAILVVLIAFAAMDYINAMINRIDFKTLGAELIIGYILFMGIYLGITYIVSSVRYNRAKRASREYEEMLRRLEKEYLKEDMPR